MLSIAKREGEGEREMIIFILKNTKINPHSFNKKKNLKISSFFILIQIVVFD